MSCDRREFLALGMGALAVSAFPFALRTRPSLIRRRIPVMGTLAEIVVRSGDEAGADRAIAAAFGELRRVEAAMTRFRADSDVGALNGSMGGWVTTCEDTSHVLSEARRWASVSEGRFDPCLGRAAELWDVARRTRPPEGREVVSFANQGLWGSLEIDRMSTLPRARLTEAAAAVDLGGIAKGFGVDAAADALRRHGVCDGLVNVGGDLVALGSDDSEEPWLIGVRSPDTPEGIVAELRVSDEAVATSGDYLQFFQHGGRRYHHLLDPATGSPRRTSMRSLTVRAKRCLDADAAATALFGAPKTVTAEVLGCVGAGVRVIHEIEEVTS